MAGKGYARGFELFWRDKRTFKNSDYWITYTFLDTRRQYLNFPLSLPPTFTTPHTATVVAQHSFEKIKTIIGIAYSVASGRPYYFIGTHPETNQPVISNQGITGHIAI